MAFKQRLLSTWHRFLQTNFNIYFRSAPPIGKQRLYKHTDIQQSFEQFEKQRKQQRLQLQEYKQQVKKSILQKELKLLESLNSQEIAYIDKEKKPSKVATMNEEILNRIQRMKVPLETGDKTSRKDELTQQIQQIEQQLDQLKKQNDELQVIDSGLSELEPDYVLLSNIEKKIVLNQIAYYEFQNRHIAGVTLNPESMKVMEIVHNHVQNNLPVKRDLLYEAVPELFETEIGELSEYKQKMIAEKRPQLQTDIGSVIRVVEKQTKYQEKHSKLEYVEQLRIQELEMMNFVFKKASEFCDKHDDFMEMKMATGLVSEHQVVESVMQKDKTDLSEAENVFLGDYLALKKINDDYHDLLEVNSVKYTRESKVAVVPEFVKQNPRLHKVWLEKWEQIIGNSFDISESMLLPRGSYESQLDKVIVDYRKKDIEQLISESNDDYKARLGEKQLLRQDRIDKDSQLTDKLKVMADLMQNVPPDPYFADQQDKKTKMLEGMAERDNPVLKHTEQEGRIMMEHLPRVLHLNNTNPQKYNLAFWAEHFNIEPQKLRNIFNYVSYPILGNDNNKKESSRVLRFIIFNESQQPLKVATSTQSQLTKDS